ncbi:MAG TPA: outer membrane beta-barrel protein, partial [Thermoanaerobaculia bacterium]|nr:outer membrane beta-barrel protein [Thermoanaerobaculia bacterium]
MRLLLVLLLAALPLRAADVEIGVQHVATMMMGETTFDGLELEVETTRGFAASGELFLSEQLSARVGATFINPVAIINPGDIDLNTVSLDIYSAGARWHFAPASRFSTFAGGGGAYVSFGNLETRFTDDVELTLGGETALYVEGGARYRVLPRLSIEAALSYMPLEAETRVVLNDRPGL